MIGLTDWEKRVMEVYALTGDAEETARALSRKEERPVSRDNVYSAAKSIRAKLKAFQDGINLFNALVRTAKAKGRHVQNQFLRTFTPRAPMKTLSDEEVVNILEQRDERRKREGRESLFD